MTYTPEVDRLVSQYRDRRTVAGELVRRIEDAAQHDVDVAVGRTQGELEATQREHERVVARLEERIETFRKERDAQAAQLRAYREQQTNLRETRETIDDGTLVRIQAPRFSSYGDRTAPRPWTLEEVETIVHRLRMAGAVDDTEVRFKHEHTEATVPFPEFALEPATAAPPEPRLPDTKRTVPARWSLLQQVRRTPRAALLLIPVGLIVDLLARWLS